MRADPPTTACNTRCTPSVCACRCGTSTTSMPPRSCVPQVTCCSLSSWGRQRLGRLHRDDDETGCRCPRRVAAMLPCNLVGSWGPAATCAQFADRNQPVGQFAGGKNPGRWAREDIGDGVFRSKARLPRHLGDVAGRAVVELASMAADRRQHTDPTASTAFVVNLPNAAPELRNVDTVLTSRSAANCGAVADAPTPSISRRPDHLPGYPVDLVDHLPCSPITDPHRSRRRHDRHLRHRPVAVHDRSHRHIVGKHARGQTVGRRPGRPRTTHR